MLQGRDTLIVAAMMFGAKGAVPTTSNLMPQLFARMYESFVAGDVEGAKRLQARLSPIRLGLTVGTGPGVLKSMMGLVDFPVGPSRGPIAPLPDEVMAKLRAIIERI